MGYLWNVDRARLPVAGLIMKKIFFIVAIFLVIGSLVSPILAAPTAAFNVYYLNTTNGTGTWDPLTNMNATKAQLLAFNASSGGAVSWGWKFGDGKQASGKDVTHQYSYSNKWLVYKNGETPMTVILNATDAGGVSDYETKVINLSVALDRIVMVTETIPTLNESYAQSFIDVIGGNESPQEGWIGIDFLGGLETSRDVYVSVLGYTIFSMLIFSLPFLMNWIVSKDFVVAGVLGMFMGIYIVSRLPAQMQLLAVAFIGMSIVAIIYSLIKERI